MGPMWRLAYAAGGLLVLYWLIAYVVLPSWWKHYEHQPGLAMRPMVTHTQQGIPGDPINIGLVGAKADVLRAMSAAGWNAADALTFESGLKIGLSVVFDRPYAEAPVSTLLYDGRPQDLAFERAVGGSPDRRHHVRFWLVLANGAEHREVWLGAASFDVAVGISHDTGQITHHIAPDVDAERDFVISTLSEARTLSGIYQVTGVGATLMGRNGEGDRYFTDGEVTIGVIAASVDGREELDPVAPAITFKNQLWRLLVAVGQLAGVVPVER